MRKKRRSTQRQQKYKVWLWGCLLCLVKKMFKRPSKHFLKRHKKTPQSQKLYVCYFCVFSSLGQTKAGGGTAGPMFALLEAVHAKGAREALCRIAPPMEHLPSSRMIARIRASMRCWEVEEALAEVSVSVLVKGVGVHDVSVQPVVDVALGNEQGLKPVNKEDKTHKDQTSDTFGSEVVVLPSTLIFKRPRKFRLQSTTKSLRAKTLTFLCAFHWRGEPSTYAPTPW